MVLITTWGASSTSVGAIRSVKSVAFSVARRGAIACANAGRSSPAPAAIRVTHPSRPNSLRFMPPSNRRVVPLSVCFRKSLSDQAPGPLAVIWRSTNAGRFYVWRWKRLQSKGLKAKGFQRSASACTTHQASLRADQPRWHRGTCHKARLLATSTRRYAHLAAEHPSSTQAA